MLRSVCFAFALSMITLAACADEAASLLINGDFSAAGERIAAWDTGRTTHAVSVDKDQRPEAVPQSLRIEVTSAHEGRIGEILQRVKLKPDTRYTVSGDVKGSAKDMAVIQVKRLREGKEVERITTAWSTTEWTNLSRTFNSGDADEVLVILRWRQNAEHVGKSVWFANVALREGGAQVKPEEAREPHAVPTFNSIGLYWKPAGGSPDRQAKVSYRPKGSADWREAMPLWFDENEHAAEAAEHTFEYRGSIVHLQPATTYEVSLTLEKSDQSRMIEVTTWTETPRIARTVELPADPGGTYTITEGGSEAQGYVLYTAPAGQPLTWDAQGEATVQVRIDASYVILRGLTLKNAARHGIELGNVQDVIIEDCDVSGWGRISPDGFGHNLDSAIYSESRQLERIVVQRCNLHHPRSDSNSWAQERMHDGRKTKHPIGPQGITFRQGRGQYVLRFNRIHSDLDHMFNDAMGETRNFSYGAFPNRDSDIHDNFISHCWDDGLEIEGANMNVRVWNNYIDLTYGAIGAASTSLGPSYFWRNVYAVSRKHEGTSPNDLRGHYLVKLGSEKAQWARGRCYVFHNTILQPPGFPEGPDATSGAQSGVVDTSMTKYTQNIVTRNNIIHLRHDNSIAYRNARKFANVDFDHDLYNGVFTAPDGALANAINATPVYERAPDGRLWLKPGTPGHDAAVRIPNFNDDFVGAAPDMGAVETGTSAPKPPLWPEFPPPPKVEVVAEQ